MGHVLEYSGHRTQWKRWSMQCIKEERHAASCQFLGLWWTNYLTRLSLDIMHLPMVPACKWNLNKQRVPHARSHSTRLSVVLPSWKLYIVCMFLCMKQDISNRGMVSVTVCLADDSYQFQHSVNCSKLMRLQQCCASSKYRTDGRLLHRQSQPVLQRHRRLHVLFHVHKWFSGGSGSPVIQCYALYASVPMCGHCHPLSSTISAIQCELPKIGHRIKVSR